MRLVRLVVAVVAAAGLCASVANAAAPKDRPLYKEGEVIVKFKSGAVVVAGAAAGTADLAAMQASVRRVHPEAAIARTMANVGRPTNTLVRFPSRVSVESMVAAFRARPDVEFAEPNYMAYIPKIGTRQPTSPLRRMIEDKNGTVRALTSKEVSAFAQSNPTEDLDNLNGWFWTGADIIWPDAKANPVVAVLDTGADIKHPDLFGKVLAGGDYINGGKVTEDDNGHGTHVAGIVSAKINNAIGTAGISTAKVLAIKVLDAQGAGTFFDIANGIYEAAANTSVRVISMSLGGQTPGNATPAILQNALNTAAVIKGKLVVAAAGNDGVDEVVWPAFFANQGTSGSASCAATCATFPAFLNKVMAVAADGLYRYTDTTHNTINSVDYSCMGNVDGSRYSNFGNWVTISAPGSAIYSTTPYNKNFYLNTYDGVSQNYAFLDGTSMATPFVAGAAARVFSKDLTQTNDQVAALLVSSGSTGPSGQIGSNTTYDGTNTVHCWETGNSTAMTDLRVDEAMVRGQINGQVFDAKSATGLRGAKVTAYKGSAAVGYGGIVDDAATGTGDFRIINVPFEGDPTLTFKVTKALYTSGAQAFDTRQVFNSPFNRNVFIPHISVPPNKNWWFVTEWSSNFAHDQYLYTPLGSAIQCGVGVDGAAALCGPGSLVTAPFMRLMHNGGVYYATVTPGDSLTMDATEIKPPLAVGAPGAGYSHVFKDSNTWWGGSSYYTRVNPAILRVWLNGAIKSTVNAGLGDVTTNTCTTIGPGSTICSCWQGGTLSSAGIFTPTNIFGTCDLTATGVLPYSFAGRVSASGSSR